MLFLDHNIQKRVAEFLASNGSPCKRAQELGWEEKRNGELVEACSENGFTAILTNDQKFSESAARALKKHPTICIIILTLEQGPIAAYLSRFTAAWNNGPPTATPGKVVHWP